MSHEFQNRRTATPDNNINGAPWYIAVLYKYGVPAGIAIYLVFKLTSGLPNAADVTEVKSLLNVHVTATEAKLVEVQMLLRAICYNTAKDEQASRGCAAPAVK